MDEHTAKELVIAYMESRRNFPDSPESEDPTDKAVLELVREAAQILRLPDAKLTRPDPDDLFKPQLPRGGLRTKQRWW